ncbi:MAG: hypothetical protein WD229_06755 [Pirellulales bacterium]
MNGDYIGTPDYVVTSIADTYDGSSDPVNMSIRDAIHRANITAGTQEIWLPAWNFVLTRQRTTAPNLIEMNVSEGDLEIDQSLIIRGIDGSTSVAWAPEAAVDKVFELLGDYNSDGSVDAADYVIWQTGNLAADGDDDGDVDGADLAVRNANFGNTLTLTGILVS